MRAASHLRGFAAPVIGIVLNCCAFGTAGAADLGSLRAWLASAQMTLEEWVAGALPGTFTRQALQRVEAELADGSPTISAPKARDILQHLQGELTTAAKAVAAGDRRTAQRALAGIRAANDQLDELARVLEASGQ